LYSKSRSRAIILEKTLANWTGVFGSLTLGTGNALPFATIFLTVCFLSALGIADRKPIEKVFAGGAIFLGVITILFWNMTRGASIVIVPLTVLFVWYTSDYLTRNISRSFLTVMSGIFILFCYLLFNFYDFSFMSHGLKTLVDFKTITRNLNDPEIYRRFGVLGKIAVDESILQRIIMYRAGFLAWLENPIFGYGLENRFSATIRYMPIEVNWRYSHLHNAFITHAVAGGVIALLSLTMVLISPILSLFNKCSTASQDSIYFSAVIVISMFGSGASNLILFHDLLGNFFAVLILINTISMCKIPPPKSLN